jgi:hypothetical protein
MRLIRRNWNGIAVGELLGPRDYTHGSADQTHNFGDNNQKEAHHFAQHRWRWFVEE